MNYGGTGEMLGSLFNDSHLQSGKAPLCAVHAMGPEHRASKAAKHVTISAGVATVRLAAFADLAASKRAGCNSVDEVDSER